MSGELRISLTTEQLKVLLAGAARVPQTWRRRFLDDVADQLLWHLVRAPQLLPPTTTDETVSQAVGATLARIGITNQTNEESHHGNISKQAAQR